MKKTTLCYIENNGSYLMLYRNRKPDDPNEGKWLGIGGKIEEGETPDECNVREVFEETGLLIKSAFFHGVIEFRSDEYEDEDMYLYSVSAESSGAPDPYSHLHATGGFVPADNEAARRFAETGEYEPSVCSEGELRWIAREDLLDLPMWEGDRAFLTELLNGAKEIKMRLQYTGESCTVITKP